MIPSQLHCLSGFMLLVYTPVHRALKCTYDFMHVNSTAVIESLHLMTNSIGFNRI